MAVETNWLAVQQRVVTPKGQSSVRTTVRRRSELSPSVECTDLVECFALCYAVCGVVCVLVDVERDPPRRETPGRRRRLRERQRPREVSSDLG